MNELQYTVVQHSKMGDRYLCGIETFCYGDRILGYFCPSRSCVMPLTLDQATKICAMLRDSLPCHDLAVIPVPWSLPERGLTGNV